MNIFIDREKLLALLRDLHLLTGFRAGVFDASFRMIAVYPSDHGEYCSLVRESEQGLAQCDACDRDACEKCGRLGRLVIYRCHAGLGEAVLPLYHEHTVIGYVMMGEMRPAKEEIRQMEEVWQRLAGYGLDVQKLKECYSRKNKITDEVAVAAANILRAVSAYLHLDGVIAVRELSATERLDTFLEENLDTALSVDVLCSFLSVSRARLYALFEERYGMGVAEYIRLCRIKRAKRLLTETSLPIAMVAAQCGFPDYNYLSKVFKRYCGMSPRDYRKANSNAATR